MCLASPTLSQKHREEGNVDDLIRFIFTFSECFSQMNLVSDKNKKYNYKDNHSMTY